MTYRTPYLQVLGANDEDMLTAWGSKLIGVKIIDRQDGESDEAIFMFTRKRPYMPIPGLGAPYTVRVGWSAESSAITGYYTFQRVHIFGAPRQGQQLHLICRGADFIDHLKRVDSEHFDEANGSKTLGDVFNKAFKATGAKVLIHPDIAKAPIPGGYILRWNQSLIDFAMRIAEENSAIVKPMDGKIVVLKKGSLQSVSGKDLPAIQMPFDENYEFDFELEPLYEYSKVAASYLDTEKGTLENEGNKSGGGAKLYALPHPFASKDAAQAGANAEAQGLKQFTATGTFTKVGDPLAVSGAPVRCTDFGTPIDETEWEAHVVTHDIIPNIGWTTTVETQTVG